MTRFVCNYKNLFPDFLTFIFCARKCDSMLMMKSSFLMDRMLAFSRSDWWENERKLLNLLKLMNSYFKVSLLGNLMQLVELFRSIE